MRAADRRSMRSHSVYWRCHCVAAEMLAMVLRAPRRSAFFLDAVGSLLERFSGVAWVLLNTCTCIITLKCNDHIFQRV